MSKALGKILKDIEAAIFDLDDTLYPERDYVASGFRHISGYLEMKYGWQREEVYNLLMADFEKGLRGKNFDVLLEKMGLERRDHIIPELVNEYRSHTPKISLPSSSVEVLSYLRSRGLLLGLVTDGHIECQKKKVESLGLEKYMDAIVYTDSWGKEFWKPSPRGYIEASYILDVDVSKCCYIADNPEKDFKGAKACGMHTLQLVQWETRDARLLPEEYRPEAVLDALTDLIAILKDGYG